MTFLRHLLLLLFLCFSAHAQGTFNVTITGGPMYSYTLSAQRETSPGVWSQVGSVAASSTGLKTFTSGAYAGPGGTSSCGFRIVLLYSGGLVYILSPTTTLTGSGTWTYTGAFNTTGYGLYTHTSGASAKPEKFDPDSAPADDDGSESAGDLVPDTQSKVRASAEFVVATYIDGDDGPTPGDLRMKGSFNLLALKGELVNPFRSMTEHIPGLGTIEIAIRVL